MPKSKFYAMREMVYDRCLRTGREFTGSALLEEVNKELKIRDMAPVQSRKTFMQDMQEMNAKLHTVYGHNVICSERRGNQVYYRYVDSSECLYDRTLTDEEVDRLQQVSTLLQGLNGLPGADWLNELSIRFDQFSRSPRQQVVSFESGTERDTRFYQPLFDAITRQQALLMRYQKFDAEPTKRVVHPYYLKQYRLRWYLFCYDERRRHIGCFALDRIQSISRAEGVTYRTTDTDFKHYFDNIIGVTKPEEGRVEHVRLRTDHWMANYLQTSPLHATQRVEEEDEEGCVLTLDVMLNHELEQELLFLGEHVRVLGPEELCQRMKARIDSMINLF